MSRLATLLLLLFATGLIVLVATTQRWRLSTERRIQPGSALFQFTPEDISAIQIKNGDQSFRLERISEKWFIRSTTTDVASPEALGALIGTALDTAVLDRIDASEIRDEKNLSRYGVLKSSLQLDFKGDRPASLLFGKTTPDGSRVYVSFEGSKTVYLIPNDLARLITLTPDTFRDRRLAVIDPEQTRRIVIRKDHTTLELSRDARGWRITKPLVADADNEAVDKWIKQLRRLTLESFESRSTNTPSPSPPLEPSSRIQFFTEDGEKPVTITLEKPAADGSLTAHLEPRNITCRVPAATAEIFSIDLEKLRDRTLARLNIDMVDLIRIQQNTTTRDITRTPQGWTADPAAIQGFLQALADCKVTTYKPATSAELDTYGLSTPTLRVAFLAVLSENTPEARAGEHPVLVLDIGPPLPDGNIPIHTQGTPEIAIVPPALLDALPRQAELSAEPESP